MDFTKLAQRIFPVFIVAFSLFWACGCGGNSPQSNPKFEIEDISDEIFILGEKSDDFMLKIKDGNYDIGDIKYYITDSSIFDISIWKDSTSRAGNVYFNITGQKVGTTYMYFQTSDLKARSQPIEISVCRNITSISFKDTSDIYLSEEQRDKICQIVVCDNGNEFDYNKEFECISENEDVAAVRLENSFNSTYCRVEMVGEGETKIYIKSKDGVLNTERIRVVCSSSSREKADVAYITPTGKKYHYDKSCAGLNAVTVEDRTMLDGYEPCKRCAQ